MKLGLAIGQVANSEEELADSLLKLGERHRTDHDVFHITRLLSRWAQGHLTALEPFGPRYGSDLEADGIGRERSGPLAVLREKSGEILGRRPEAGLLLLRDLRTLHLLATETSINWTMLGQAAQAAKHRNLIQCVSLCHPETLRTMRWSLTKLKEATPQILTS
jgi:hypothetical protein